MNDSGAYTSWLNTTYTNENVKIKVIISTIISHKNGVCLEDGFCFFYYIQTFVDAGNTVCLHKSWLRYLNGGFNGKFRRTKKTCYIKLHKLVF